MLDFKTPLNWFMMTDKIGIIVRIIIMTIELAFYIILVSYYKSNSSNKNYSFWEWLKD